MKLPKLKNLTGVALPIVAGGFGAKLVKNFSGKVTQNDKIRAAAPFIIGLLMISAKGNAMKHAGYGMIAVGGADLVTSFFPSLAGIEDMDLSGVLNGTDDEIFGGGVTGVDGVLNGTDDGQYDDNY